MKIAINLLPIEFRTDQIKKAKFLKIQVIGISVVVVVAFLASITVALRVLQSQNMLRTQKQLTGVEEQAVNFKGTETSLLLLKDRLKTITQIFNSPSTQTDMYKIVSSLLPSSIAVNSISVDEGGIVSVEAVVADADTLEELIGNLTTQLSSQDKIKQVSLENVSRGKEEFYKIVFKVNPK